MKIQHRMLVLFVTLLTSMTFTQMAMASGGKHGSKNSSQQEAISIVQDLDARISNAFDNALESDGNGPDFNTNLDYVLALQFDQNKMDMTINDTNVTDVDDYKALWYLLAKQIQYRRRLLTNSIVVDYKVHKSLRTITLYVVGTSFVIFRDPSAKSAIIVDRCETTWEEKCPGQFRLKKYTRMDESSFPLSTEASIISSPVDPKAQAVYVPPPVEPCK